MYDNCMSRFFFMPTKIHIVDSLVLLYISSLFLLYDNARPLVELLSIIAILLFYGIHGLPDYSYVVMRLIFLLICTISVLWSADRTASLFASRGVFECLICSVVLQMYIKTFNEIEKVIKYCLYMSFFMILKLIILVPLEKIVNRQFPADMNANSIGIRLAFCFAFTFWLIKAKYGYKLRYIVVAAVLGMGSLFSGSKKALLILLISVVVLELSYSKNIFYTIKYMVLSIVIVGICYYVLLNNDLMYTVIGHRVEGMVKGIIYGSQYADASTKERIILMQFAKEKWKQHPFCGHGIHSFEKVIGYKGYGNKNLYSHNNYLELLFGVGILGTFSYYCILPFMLLRALKNYDRNLSIFTILNIIIIVFIDVAMVSYGDEFMQFIFALAFSALSCIKRCRNNYLESFSLI